MVLLVAICVLVCSCYFYFWLCFLSLLLFFNFSPVRISCRFQDWDWEVLRESPEISYADVFTYVVLVENSYGNIDMFTFEPSQSEERRADLADSSKAFNKPKAFNITLKTYYLFFEKITSPHAFPTKLFKRIAPKLRLVIFEKTKLW